MKKFLMILSVFAFLATSMAGLAHAEDASKDGCDMACSGCHVHCHNHIASHSHDGLSALFGAKEKRVLGQELIYLSDLTYGLKRPPKA